MSYRFAFLLLMLGINASFFSTAYAVCSLKETVHYNSSARRMDEALQDFAHQSGCFVQVTPDVIKNRYAASLHGEYRPLQALRRLLRHYPYLRADTTQDGLLIRDTQHRT